MTRATESTNLPRTLAEFIEWESNDGFKYEWNDGELIRFSGMKKKHLKLIKKLSRLFAVTKAYKNGGELICEQDVMLTGIQLRRPDMGYFSNDQIESEEEAIPAFCIEVISTHDQINDVKKKIKEYFEHGVQVVWIILPDEAMVEIYTSVKDVKICMGADICSASPVLEDFNIQVNELLQ
jgi:Uma2 family endonuclease